MNKVTHGIVVWIFDSFDNNLGIKNYFIKYLRKSWLQYSDEIVVWIFDSFENNFKIENNFKNT